MGRLRVDKEDRREAALGDKPCPPLDSDDMRAVAGDRLDTPHVALSSALLLLVWLWL